MWKKSLQISLWSLTIAGICTLFIAAMQKKEEKKCADINIEIRGANNHFFVDKKDILETISETGAAKGKEILAIELKKVEERIEKNVWIKKAELFFDNKQVLHANIEEREPIARVFTLEGRSYYIDSSCNRLPLSDKLSARVPMFTSFPSDKKILSRPDSSVLMDVKQIAQYIQQDSFWMAQVAQVDITRNGTYEMIPVIGDQVIRLGDATNLNEKFTKLKNFYQQVWTKTGFEKYEIINIQYASQVVATKRGAGKLYMDTAKALQQFGSVSQRIKSVLNDTAFTAPVVKPVIVKDSLADVAKQDDSKKAKTIKHAKIEKKTNTIVNKKKAKAVMKKQ
jgi:cell division protein FtsQ